VNDLRPYVRRDGDRWLAGILRLHRPVGIETTVFRDRDGHPIRYASRREAAKAAREALWAIYNPPCRVAKPPGE